MKWNDFLWNIYVVSMRPDPYVAVFWASFEHVVTEHEL